MSLKDRVIEIYDYISSNLYFGRSDFEISGERFNSTLIFSLLTAITGGKELIIGEPGLGKTTLAEYVASLVYSLPLEVIYASEVSGNPELTEEKIVGRPDIGRLNLGEESVVWSYFVQVAPKIVDEMNRIPESKQSLILNGTDRGIWKYMNESLINREGCLFATINYSDRGTVSLIPPLLDRFDITVESKHPGPNHASMVARNESKEVFEKLHSKNASDLFKVLDEKVPFSKKKEQIDRISETFGGLSSEDRENIRVDIGGMEVSEDAEILLRMLISEFSFCHVFGQRRADEVCVEGCHYLGYLCSRVKNCISNRFPSSVINYSKALAWILSEEVVSLEHLKKVAPYALAHRVMWRDSNLSRHLTDIRDEPLHIHLAKLAVDEVSYRIEEQLSLIKQNLSLANQKYKGNKTIEILGEHPLFSEIRKDLKQR